MDRQGRHLGANVCKRIDNNDLMATAGRDYSGLCLISGKGLRRIVIDTAGTRCGPVRSTGKEQLFATGGWRQLRRPRLRREAISQTAGAEIWDAMREWFEDPTGVQVPDSDEFKATSARQFAARGATHFIQRGGSCSKARDHIKERLSFSPDYRGTRP